MRATSSLGISAGYRSVRSRAASSLADALLDERRELIERATNSPEIFTIPDVGNCAGAYAPSDESGNVTKHCQAAGLAQDGAQSQGFAKTPRILQVVRRTLPVRAPAGRYHTTVKVPLPAECL
jgi:hypothetical protein